MTTRNDHAPTGRHDGITQTHRAWGYGGDVDQTLAMDQDWPVPR
jgi:hypothetical protein